VAPVSSPNSAFALAIALRSGFDAPFQIPQARSVAARAMGGTLARLFVMRSAIR
jgi:hypothetical protein